MALTFISLTENNIIIGVFFLTHFYLITWVQH